MAFHHLLLAICRAHPAVQQEVEQRIKCFLSGEGQGVKSQVPNLGEFICLLSASAIYSWEQVAKPLLAEVFDRNVLWLLKKHPHLGELTDTGVSEQRLRLTFKSAVVSMRLIMFNVWFLNNVAKAPHVHDETSGSGSRRICAAPSCTLARYDRTYGLPPQQQVEAVHLAVRRICEVCTWQGYFEAVGLKPIAAPALCEWLRRSVVASRRKGYHRGSVGQPKWARQRQPAEAQEAHEKYDALADAWEG